MVSAPDRPMETSNPLSEDELRKIDAYWRACNYLAVGMIYLRENPLLKESLKPSDVKHRLLGHWGSSPGLSFIYIHLNRLIKKYDLDMIYLAGPGHGAPGVLGPVYLEGTYSEIYPNISEDAEGMQKFFKQFSFPGGIGSHCTPETPGSIHEGGELGYSLSHAYGSVFDNPGLISVCVVGDGEAETGALATAWHSNKFLNPIRDGAVLPVLHLNGYKIANPTILSRISHEELEALFKGYGYKPYFVEGCDPALMHQKMADILETAISEIKAIQAEARSTGIAKRPLWPMIVLRSPKGWTGPTEVNGHKVEGFWRSHQVPMADVTTNPTHLKLLEDWMRSYKPEELFDANGRLIPELKDLAPQGTKRMSASPHANGGVLRKDLRLQDFRDYGVPVEYPGKSEVENTNPLGKFLRDVMRNNLQNFRVFGPDETASNRLNAIYEVSKKTWMGDFLPEDLDGSELATDGRVMEILSEHTLEGWLEGYLLTGRHGFFHTYEAFAHVIDSMFNQHAKWLDICRNEVSWRSPISSLNILLSSTVWRQDHNGFSHQDPGFLDVVTNKSASVTRIYLPPDANCLLSVADHCLKSTNYINVIVADKQKHLQFLTMDEAIKHCTKGIGIWEWASSDDCGKDPDIPDVIMAGCGDVATMESLAATAILREEIPDLKVRFVNVVDLFKLQPDTEHPHGLSDRDFDSLFTTDKPIIFNFHGYPWLIHKLAYRRKNHANMHVRGYKEKGNINTPLELAINNQVDRFNLVIDVIDRVPKLGSAAAYVRERMKNAIIENVNYAHEHGIDKDEIVNWKWPF
ncbi:phosphoketolase family protein [Planktothrix agardhii 1029]|uniref:phosphoketolase family protein n=1 Tax=Planktothrix agardhii TaxID=1160 RepID=UPI001D0B2C9C|nr:phosphoketolase family protein [Planktothrix agardhii]MCB8763789.1 phosphoketolase family protein [Planktothrix agardhii 1809]MCB8781846.1 phosphoketolase family protein [Planktothrix agardhii 1808]MCF3568598.1 phosphoketolase family protein [Planktothrix agardhii 1807]MCF3590300.1 phosphoketolase family protein [Planktothrix agardhii 1029]MCF3620234.1 phosphoketolase family protein [Planktothrix agardhii 1030]